MNKSRFKTNIATEIRAKNNQSDPSKNLLENKTLHNIVENKDLLRDLGIFNNEYL